MQPMHDSHVRTMRSRPQQLKSLVVTLHSWGHCSIVSLWIMDSPDSVVQRFSMWISCTCPGSWGKFNWNVFPPWQRCIILPALLPRLPKQQAEKEHLSPLKFPGVVSPLWCHNKGFCDWLHCLGTQFKALTPALTTAWLTEAWGHLLTRRLLLPSIAPQLARTK
jgi:hypothetical protein